MKILLVKLSSLGDVVHALPVVQDIHAAIPAAQVDWVVEKSFAPLLSRAPGIHRVIACEIRRWRKSFWASATRTEWRAFRADLQRDAYDAVIDLQGLTKSAVVARLARLAPGGQRYALGNQTDGSGYEAPTRWVADVAVTLTPHIHAVQRSRELAARALGYTPAEAPDFGLNRPAAQDGRGLAAIKTVAEADFGNSPESTEAVKGRVVLVHGTSRADKEWPLANWVALGLRLDAAGCPLTLAHGNAKELATSEAIAEALLAGGCARAPRVLPVLSLDQLTDELAASAGVVGVDSGVSHIAVALNLPHVQLYNFDTAWRTGPVGNARQVAVFASAAPSVDAVWQAWLAVTSASQAASA